jgi:GDPmannose 4,6-dehydratase
MGQSTAVIFGASGQDGSYLGEFLLEKDYRVIGVRRRSSGGSLWRLEKCLKNKNYELIEGDITDYPSILNILSYYKPNEIYNLSAQSNVGTSFNQPINTWRICAEGVINLLESIKFLKLPTKLYQASSSEMFGNSISWYVSDWMKTGGWHLKVEDINKIEHDVKEKITEVYQNEKTPFNPQSPYAIAKLAAHNSIKLYREAYGMYAVGGILFNHESPRRGVNFVTRKITSWFKKVVKFRLDLVRTGWPYWEEHDKLKLGNLNSYRDWGYAEEFVEPMWLMLQQDNPRDYVIGTGETHSISEFLEEVKKYHSPKLDLNELVEIDENCKRPAEVPYLCADASLAEKELGWKPKTKFKDLVKIMCEAENGLA